MSWPSYYSPILLSMAAGCSKGVLLSLEEGICTWDTESR